MKPGAFAVVLSVLSAGLNARDYEPFISQSAPAKLRGRLRKHGRFC
jgi:hypothetical protein